MTQLWESESNMQYKIANQMQEKSKDTKGVIISRTSKKNRQYNGQKKRDKRTNNDLQNHRLGNTNPTEYRGELRCSRKVSGIRRVAKCNKT
jgi:hypothetical protein